MIEAIIYDPEEGFTKEYAEILKQELGLKIYTIDEGKKKLLQNTEVVFITEVFSTKVLGVSKASKHFSVRYVLGVGMADFDKETEDIIYGDNAKIEGSFFYLPGGLDLNNAKGLNKVALKTMSLYYKNLEKEAKKQNKELLPKDQDMVNMFNEGYVNKVSKTHLQRFLSRFVR